MVIYSDTRRRLEAEKRIEADDIHKAYMTVSEVQYLLRVSERTVRKLTRDGILPSFKIGTAIRISRDGLLKWIEAGGTNDDKQ
jgi:excisionase family DNA binding protein